MLEGQKITGGEELPAFSDRFVSTVGHKIKLLPPNKDILIGRQNMDNIYVILEGWAIRYSAFADGRRQINAVLVRGDICHLDMFSERPVDSAVATITPVRVGVISRRMLRPLMETNASLAQALMWEIFASATRQQEWTVSLARRTPAERLGHFFCEIHERLRAIDQAEGDSCYFPLTQSDLADMMGLTPVHINRTLQWLRAAELVILNRRRLTIPDPAALREFSLFDPQYLHIPQLAAARAAIDCVIG